ncbi:MAG: DNA internalization-related competence protein ComEC/Rec2 [Gemmatimonadota bacterium]
MPLIARIAMVFAGGAIAGSFLSDVPILMTVIVCGALLLFSRAREPALLCAIALAGCALGALRAGADRSQCPPIGDRTAVSVEGVLESTPTEAQPTVPLRSEACRYRVRVPDGASFTIGDEVQVRGEWMTVRITPERKPSREGLIIAHNIARSRNPAFARSGMLRVRGRTQERIHELFPITYPLAEALLIAQRENLNVSVRESFAASGLTHLLAISGTHVALVAAALLLFTRLLRLSRRAAAIISIAGSAAYVFFLGAPFAALRALIQMTLLLASRGLQRPAHPLGLLSAAAVGITLIDPAAPLDAGFQLSFAGIFGIILWRRPLIELLPRSIPTPVREAIATTCAATAITTPIAAFHFGTVSIVALIANLLAIPVVSLAVPIAAAALALSAIDQDLARFIAGGAELTLLWLNSIAQKCAQVPGGHFNVTQLGIVASTLTVIVAYGVMRERHHSTLRGRSAVAALAAALPIVVLPLLAAADRNLQIHMIDVGQGDALAIRSPRGRWLLLDAGPASDRHDAGKSQVVPFLLQHQASRVTAAILSHPHLDHFGGLRGVMQRMPVTAIIDPGMAVTSAQFDSLLAFAQQRRVPWLLARPRSRMNFDGVHIDFLAPDRVTLDAFADANEVSVAFLLSYGKFTGLFLGDLPAAVETDLVNRYGARLDVDLLKVAHHGSGGSSSEALLLATTPAVALVPVGRRNRYGHPHPKALERLGQVNARVFRTDRDGSVSVVVRGDGAMSVRTRQ